MNNLVPFSFEGAAIRVVTRDGEPWFVAADVCRVLEHSNSRMAVASLGDDEKGVSIVYTPGGQQQMTIINESGLYSLVFNSRKPEAQRFRKWITAEVIPSIRKTGGYGAPAVADLDDPATLRLLLAGYAEKRLVLEAENAALKPKAAALDKLASSEGSLCLTDAAKTLGIKRKRLLTWLHDNWWIYPRAGRWVAYDEKRSRGLLEHAAGHYEGRDGEPRVATYAVITAKGLAKLAEVFSKPG